MRVEIPTCSRRPAQLVRKSLNDDFFIVLLKPASLARNNNLSCLKCFSGLTLVAGVRDVNRHSWINAFFLGVV